MIVWETVVLLQQAALSPGELSAVSVHFYDFIINAREL